MSGERRHRRRKRKVVWAPRYLEDKEEHQVDTNAVVLNKRNDGLVRNMFRTPATCRCFVLKSFSEANLHKSLKYGVWASTESHNAILDAAFNSDLAAVRPILLFFSVCDSRHFNGIARMTSSVDQSKQFALWEKQKYTGVFHLDWLLVKDVPNHALTSIKMSNTPTKKSITSCRDCEEVPFQEAQLFLDQFLSFPTLSSAFDDMKYYDHLQEELERKREVDGSTLDNLLVSHVPPQETPVYDAAM